MYSYVIKVLKNVSKFITFFLLSSKELQKCTYFEEGSLYLLNHPSFMTEFERISSTVLHVWYVAACNENACYRQNAITFRRLKVFNQHASDEKLPTGDELETDALCGMEVYLQRFSRGISVSFLSSRRYCSSVSCQEKGWRSRDINI